VGTFGKREGKREGECASRSVENSSPTNRVRGRAGGCWCQREGKHGTGKFDALPDGPRENIYKYVRLSKGKGGILKYE